LVTLIIEKSIRKKILKPLTRKNQRFFFTMSETRYKKLGEVKQKDLDKDFDVVYDKFKKIALDAGLTGDLKFVKERGKVLIYVAL